MYTLKLKISVVAGVIALTLAGFFFGTGDQAMSPVGALDVNGAIEQRAASSTVQYVENEGVTGVPATTLITVDESATVLVTKVIDGDTIEIEGGARVRYIGIDTPETVDPRKPVQCFGVEASNANKQLVEGKSVRLEKDVSETDKYGRLLRYVYVDDTFVNLALVQEGYARSYTYPPDVKYQEQFIAAQRVAREKEIGLWGSCPAATNVPSKVPMSAAPVPLKTASSCSIKGNISSSKERIYHVVNCGSYSRTKIDEARGERGFCSEAEVVDAGWRKALNCG